MVPKENNIKVGTIVRTIALAIALTNQILVMLGYSPIPFDEKETEYVFATILTGVTALISWWKNNSFTKEARQADELLKRLKEK